MERAERAEADVSRMLQRAQRLGAQTEREADLRARADRVVFALREQNAAVVDDRGTLCERLKKGVQQQRAAKEETHASRAESRALAIRLGLYRSVLNTDVSAIMGA